MTLEPGAPWWLLFMLYFVLPAIAGTAAINFAMARRDTAREAVRREGLSEQPHGPARPVTNGARWRSPLVAGTTILVLVIALFPQSVLNAFSVSRIWPAIAVLFLVGLGLSALAVFHAVRLIAAAGLQRWLGASVIMLCALAILMVLLPLTIGSMTTRVWQ